MAEQTPSVSKRTIIRKIAEGLAENGLIVVGRGTNTAVVKPLVEYLRKQGVNVKED